MLVLLFLTILFGGFSTVDAAEKFEPRTAIAELRKYGITPGIFNAKRVELKTRGMTGCWGHDTLMEKLIHHYDMARNITNANKWRVTLAWYYEKGLYFCEDMDPWDDYLPRAVKLYQQAGWSRAAKRVQRKLKQHERDLESCLKKYIPEDKNGRESCYW